MSVVDPAAHTRADFERVSPAVVEAASRQSAATLHEAGGRIGALPAAIKPVAPTMTVCGPALTVHSPAGDNLWLHRALAVARPGDVMVVTVSGGFEYGYWGEIMATMAQARGLAGLVIDGGVRDGRLLAQMGWPTFSRGLAIRGTGKDTGAIGWIGAPILVGDVTVQPGDLVFGDVDGIVVLPRERAAAIVEQGLRREADEAGKIERLKAGASTMQLFGLR
jgi:4-hydroxy-4-methyl-2-oxoglutarate aldolase